MIVERWLTQAAAVAVFTIQVASGRGSLVTAALLGCALAYLLDSDGDE